MDRMILFGPCFCKSVLNTYVCRFLCRKHLRHRIKKDEEGSQRREEKITGCREKSPPEVEGHGRYTAIPVGLSFFSRLWDNDIPEAGPRSFRRAREKDEHPFVKRARGNPDPGKGTEWRLILLLLFYFFPPFPPHTLPAQQEALAVNVEVPVRVFQGNRFVDDLNIEDFEVLENGVAQKIEALYLIKKTVLKKEQSGGRPGEARKRFSPQVGRHFLLMFEVTDYLPRMKEALDYFFDRVLAPQDALTVVTPRKTYRFNPRALSDLSRREISGLLKERLRQDIQIGCREYHSVLRDYRSLLASDLPADQKLFLLRDKIRELRNARRLDERRIQGLADFLKDDPGQKHVFLFYQKEIFPYPPLPFDTFAYLEIKGELMTLIPQNMERIQRIFSDASIAVHFLYITKPQREFTGDYGASSFEWEDISGGIFQTFLKMARATGGLAESSSNIAASLERASAASENYYLLYYSPKDYRADGTFRKIEVRVKGGKYRVVHREGYLAD